MPSALVVTRSFGAYKAGDHITDSAAIAKVLSGTNHAKVVAVSGTNLPLAPTPAPTAPLSA